MLTPEYLERIPDPVVQLFQDVEDDILRDMARRIKKMDGLTDTAAYQAWRLEQTRLMRQDIVTRLSKMSGKTQAEIRKILQEAGTEALLSDDAIYTAAGKVVGLINDNPALLNLLNAGYQQTAGTFQNITATTANTATKQFENALDRAWLQVSSGAFDYQTVLRRTVDALAKEGIKAILYPSGHSDTLEVATRRALLTGVNQTAAKLQLARMDEMECDLVEVTAHSGARPSHAAWQGKIYSRSGKSSKYPPFSVTGYGSGPGLCGWNCRHNFYPYWEGLSRPNYTQEDLDRMERKEFNYNGQEMTRYEASQYQRYLERNIRAYKRQYLAEEAAGVDTTRTSVKLAQWRARQKDFLDKTGLDEDNIRHRVSGFGHRQASSATAQAKKLDKIKESLYNKTDSKENQSELGYFKIRLQLDSRMDKDYYSIVKNRFSHGSEDAKNAFNRFVPENSVAKADYLGIPCYNPATKKIYMNYQADSQNVRGKGVTWYHEHGHLIDDAMGQISNDERFLKLLFADQFAYRKEYGKKHHLNTWNKVDRAISRDLNSMQKHSGVSDILQGVTKGNIQGIAGHDMNYWEKQENITGEAFAHMYEAQFDKVRYREMKKYFPNALKYFEKRLKEAL